MAAVIIKNSKGGLVRSDQHGGYNCFGPAIEGQMWRSDGHGGFNGFGPGAQGQMWRSDGHDGYNGFGPGIEGQMWRSDGNGGFNGFGAGIEGQMWRSDGDGGLNGFGPGEQGKMWRSDGPRRVQRVLIMQTRRLDPIGKIGGQDNAPDGEVPPLGYNFRNITSRSTSAILLPIPSIANACSNTG